MLSNKSTTDSGQKFHLKSISNKSMLDVSLNSAIRNSSVKNFVKNGSIVSKENEYVDDDGDVDLEKHLLELKKSCSELSQ